MHRFTVLSFLFFLAAHSVSQNDIDAIRYSRLGTGGSSRFLSMGGAFGAIGADPSCAAYNPGGLGLIRRGEISYSGSLRLTDNTGSVYNTSSSLTNANFAFNNFAIAYAWNATKDPENRHVIAFTNSQLQNFSGSTRMSGYTNSSSIAKDMLNLANQHNNKNDLNYAYEGLAYNTYLLDSVNGHFISLLDPKRTVRQTRDLVTSGKVNELNFSYAYSYKDKFYIGASIGVPRIEYTSTTTHAESDDKDSIRIAFNPDSTYTSTFVDGLPYLNADYLHIGAFNSLTYTEYFKTSGSGLNFKIGGVVRMNDAWRLGFYYHTPTVYNMNDTYYNELSTSFDQKKNAPYSARYPSKVDNGYFEYKLVTPSHLGLNTAFIINKIAVIGIDYEMINYRRAQLSSTNVSDFAGVNNAIKNKYSQGHNVRVGGEVNIRPVMVRAGYIMQGSPFGDVFSGRFVRHTASLGVGLRGKGKWYLDVVWSRTFSTEDYYLFNTLDTRATLNYNTSMLGATVGIKF